MRPLRINQAVQGELAIMWNDNHNGRMTLRTLRKNCPCAGCKHEINASEGFISLPVLKEGQYVLKSLKPVGNYALQCSWGDGHNTGIYLFDFLREICECEQCMRITAE